MSAPTPARRPLTLWRISDGRRGHDTQGRALADALLARSLGQVFHLPAAGACADGLSWLLARYARGADAADPDLILCAGHGTHLAGLAARRARGGRLVVLMQPSLPLAWFDLCLVPEHDAPPARDNVVTTFGPVCAPLPAAVRDPATGLILVGGPSRHFHWEESRLLSQVRGVLASESCAWVLADSPRTPPSTRAALAALAAGAVTHAPFDHVPTDWLPAQMARAGRIWVTCDSMSMVFETLGSGAPVGLLELRPRRTGRLTRALDGLRAGGFVTFYSRWSADQPLSPPPRRLDEAGRCAALILDRWFAAPAVPGAPA